MERWKKALKRPVTLIALAAVLLVLILAGFLAVSGRDRATDDSVPGNAGAKSDVAERGLL